MSTGTSRYSKSIMFLPAAAAADDVLVASDPIDEAIDNVVHRMKFDRIDQAIDTVIQRMTTEKRHPYSITAAEPDFILSTELDPIDQAINRVIHIGEAGEKCVQKVIQQNKQRKDKNTGATTTDEKDDDEKKEEELEVETILAKRIRKGQTQYKVKWKDCDARHNKWKPEEALRHLEVFIQYVAANDDKAKQKKKNKKEKESKTKKNIREPRPQPQSTKNSVRNRKNVAKNKSGNALEHSPSAVNCSDSSQKQSQKRSRRRRKLKRDIEGE